MSSLGDRMGMDPEGIEWADLESEETGETQGSVYDQGSEQAEGVG